MSYTLGKNLHLCFSIIKQKSPHQLTNSTNHHHHHHHSPLPPPTTTTATVFAKNYNSLFEDITSLDPTTTTTTTSVLSVSDTETDYDSSLDETGPGTPDLAAAYASRRFFISSPGRSNSIVDSPVDDHPTEVAAVGVAVETYSPDPYLDFRRSMQEMVAARGVARGDVGGAWEYLQELLLSYLTLNPKSTHKYIVRAFADVVVSSMTSSPINITSSSECFSADYCNSAYVEILNNAA